MGNQQKTPAEEKIYEVEPHEVEVRGNKEIVFFRELTAGEAEMIFGALPKEQKDSRAVFRMRKQIVQKSVCSEDGRLSYKSLDEVDALPNSRVNALFKIAAEVNGLGDKEGKESSETNG